MKQVDKSFFKILFRSKMAKDKNILMSYALNGSRIEKAVARFVLFVDGQPDTGWRTLKNGAHIKIQNGVAVAGNPAVKNAINKGDSRSYDN